MSDANLQALERAAQSDPARTLAWTRALERAGRADEAWVALCRAIEQPDVREELAGRPAWTHVSGPGKTHALDVPPVRRAPRLRWVNERVPASPWMLASPLGLVVKSRDWTGHQVLDPRDGRERRRDPRPARWLERSALLCDADAELRRPDLAHWPLHDGAAPMTIHLPEDPPPSLHRLTPRSLQPGGQLPLPPELQDHLNSGWPRVAGGYGHLLVEPRVHKDNGYYGSPVVVVGPRHLVVHHDQRRAPRSLVYELASRRLVREIPGEAWVLDAAGATLVQEQVDSTFDEPRHRRLTSADPEGEPRWGRDHLTVRAVSERAILAVYETTEDVRPRVSDLVVLDPGTGETRAVLCPWEYGTGDAAILVRDVVIVAKDGLVSGRSLDGTPLWSFDLGAALRLEPPRVCDLAPLPGALVVCCEVGEPQFGGGGDPGRIVCLEAGR